MLVPNKSQLANIDYEFNGIMVRGDCTGDVVFYGKGAGKLPTASAVVADVIDCCKHLKTRKFLYWADGNGKNILPWEESSRAMYVRANGSNVAEKAEKLFGEVTVINKADAPADEKHLLSRLCRTTNLPRRLLSLRLTVFRYFQVSVWLIYNFTEGVLST